MTYLPSLVVAAVLTASGAPSVMDFSAVDCHAFLASGQANMAATMMFLRGYHAGKTGVIPFAKINPWAGRLGKYCRDHPRANLIEASEQILRELDQGI